MDNSLLTTVTKDDSRKMSKLNVPYAHPSIDKIWNFVNGSSPTAMACTSNAKLEENRDEESRFVPRAGTAKDTMDCRIFRNKEQPCKDFFQYYPSTDNPENLANGERTTLEHAELTKVISTNGEGDLRKTNENYSVDKNLSPDRKTSMFSKEIWTEKVLPIDTFVCPEPELIEIYFDKNKLNNGSKRCSTESVNLSASRKSSNRGGLRRSLLMNPFSSAGKGSMSSSRQKTINFDDEIWPVCPKLIPSRKKLSISSLENRPKAVPPEKLNENDEEVAHSQCSRLEVASVFGVPSKASTKQCDLEGGSKSGKVIEPTHEIEDKMDSATTSAAKMFCKNNYSRSTISQVNIMTVEEPQRFPDTDRIFCGKICPGMNIIDHAESINLSDELPMSEPFDEPEVRQPLARICNSKQEMRRSFLSSESRSLKKNPLSVSYSEPVSTVLRDILKQSEVDSLPNERLSEMSRDGIISLENVQVKQSKEDYGSGFHEFPISETVEQVSLNLVKNQEGNHDHPAGTMHTRNDFKYEISRDANEPHQSSTIRCWNRIRERSVELSSSNQDTSRGIQARENCVRPLDTAPSFSELPAPDTRIFQASVEKQEIRKKRKCVKTVRFETDDGCEDVGVNTIAKRVQENCKDRTIRRAHSEARSDFTYTNGTTNSISVESLKQEIDQLADQIAKQIELDPASDDAVVTLAKVEIIVEANRQAAEKLQQLQPNIAIPRLTPPDAGKSLAQALMRCKNHMRNNGYSQDATSTINKLLTVTVQNLMQLVEWQKLALAAQRKKRCAIPGGQRQSKRSPQENSSNNEVSTAEEFGADQAQCLISDILTLTEKIVPEFNAKKSKRKFPDASNHSHSGVKSSTGNKRAILDVAPSETNHTSASIESNITPDDHASEITQRVGKAEPKSKDAIQTGSEKASMSSGAFTNDQMDNNEQSINLRGYQRAVKEVENTHVRRSTLPKRTATTESTKTLKKIFNELCEKRSKNLPRHYNVSDSPNNCQLRTSLHHTTVNQKLPVWKPGGNNFVQPSMSVIPNNPKIRPLTSSTNKKRNSISEHIRDKKAHQRTKTTPGIIKDPSKTPEKSVMKPYDMTSLAEIITVPARGHHSEVSCLDRSKVQVSTEVDETRRRKPRSKSRTRTRTPNIVSRMTITEIPLEHANSPSPVTEQKPSVNKEFPLTKKASSSPKEIIQMLEELIKFSNNETPIHNTSPAQVVVARSNFTVKDMSEDVGQSAHSKIASKFTNAAISTLSDDQGDHKIDEPSVDLTNQPKSIGDIVQKSENTGQFNNDEFASGEEQSSDRNTLAKTEDIHGRNDSISGLNAEEISAVSRSNSEVASNHFTERQTTPSVLNVGCTAELSSEHSVNSIFSKCCQASLDSVTSNEISDEFIPSQISEMEVASCCEEIHKDSRESFETVEGDEALQENHEKLFMKDESVSMKSDTLPRKKFVNRHAKSLEMLKEILSDQGLGIHLLSRAENEFKDRCKCRGLSARRSLQGPNFTTLRLSGESFNRESLPDKNLSSALFSKLATLSESESDVERVEVATMTPMNDSNASTTDHSTLARLDHHCSKEDKELSLDKVSTVETATQFDIILKSDMSVGNGIICNPYVPLSSQTPEDPAENVAPLYTTSPTSSSMKLPCEMLLVNGTESFECKLPDQIIETLKLAAIRATNCYTAVNILRENMISGSIAESSSDIKSDANEMITQLAALKPLSATGSRRRTNNIEKDHLHYLKTASSNDGGNKFLPPTYQSNNIPPVRLLAPRIRIRVNDEGNYSEQTKINSKESLRRIIVGKSVIAAKQTDENAGKKLHSAHFVESVEPSRPVVLPKPKEKIDLKKEIIDPGQVLAVGTKSFTNVKILGSVEFLQKKSHQSSLSNQQESVEGSVSEEQIRTLHFAGKQTASVVGRTSIAGSEDMIESNLRFLNGNFVSYETPRAEKTFIDSLAGSRIRTLLKKNLELFKTDYSPLIHEKDFTDFGDQLSSESSDDDQLNNELFFETNASTSCTRMDDFKIFSEVENLLKCLLNEVATNCESPKITEDHELNIHSPRYHSMRKQVRKSKSVGRNRTIKRPIVCGKNWNNSNRIIVSREHLLSIIYAAICSFVFCCLQMSVHCEV